jgi:O-antigen/teichoic acid export membrane protein
MWVGTAAGMVLARLDQLLMTPLSSVEALGYYAVAVSISEVVLVFNSAVRDVMFAMESRSPDAARISKASRMSTLITFVAALSIASITPWAIPFFFGADFAEAIPATFIMLLAVWLGNPGSVAGAALSGRGRPGLRSTSIALAAIVNVVAIFLLVPMMGAVGAALATLVGNVVAGTLNIVWLRVYFGMRLRDFYSIRLSDVKDTYLAVAALARRG